MHCHNCNSLMNVFSHEPSRLSDQVLYECPACGHRRLHLQPNAQRFAEPDRVYTTQAGSNTRRHSVWTA